MLASSKRINQKNFYSAKGKFFPGNEQDKQALSLLNLHDVIIQNPAQVSSVLDYPCYFIAANPVPGI